MVLRQCESPVANTCENIELLCPRILAVYTPNIRDLCFPQMRPVWIVPFEHYVIECLDIVSLLIVDFYEKDMHGYDDDIVYMPNTAGFTYTHVAVDREIDTLTEFGTIGSPSGIAVPVGESKTVFYFVTLILGYLYLS